MRQPRDAHPVDLLVIGAGMAGLSVAAAVEAGASVVVVEKAKSVGGSAMYAGFIWTAPTVDVMRAVNPDGDPALGRQLVEDYENAIEFVRSLGAAVAEPVEVLGFGGGRETDMAAYMLTCERTLREARRSELLLGARPQALVVDGGRVVGADIVTASGEPRRIAARSTLLATGSFGVAPELRERLIHPRARDFPLRAVGRV